MIRKLFSFLFLLNLGFSSWATGSYLGLGIGPDLINFRQNAQIIQLSNFNALDKTHLAGNGVFGTLFGGYGRSYQHLYLAAEINGTISSSKFKSSNSELVYSSYAATKYKINNSVGISILPGFLYGKDLLFYARLGYSNGHFKSNTSDVSLENISKNLDGFRVGLGSKYKLNNSWSFRMDYSYINYEQVNFKTFDNNTSKFTRIKPYTNLFEFAVIYNFDSKIPTN